MPRVIGSCLALALITMCLLLGWQQAHLALASAAIDHWIRQPVPATAQAVERYLSRANSLPDADARFLAGRWHAMRPSTAAKALERFEQAAQLRPSWYRPWSAMAMLLADSEPAGKRWRQAFREALDRGPNETRLFASLFGVWMINWHHLEPEERDALHALTLRTAWREPALVAELAEQYGYLPVLCASAQDNRLVRERCDRLGASPQPPASTP